MIPTRLADLLGRTVLRRATHRKRPAKSPSNSSIKGDGVRVFLSGRDSPYRRDFHAPTKLLPQTYPSGQTIYPAPQDQDMVCT